MFSASMLLTFYFRTYVLFKDNLLTVANCTFNTSNQPTRKLTKGGVLRKRKFSSFARLNHYFIRNAKLESEKGALNSNWGYAYANRFVRSESKLYLRIQFVPQRTQPVIFIDINLLTLLKEIIPIYKENQTEPTKSKCRITDCQSGWYIYLPYDFIKG
jgi:hypothetical protein